MQHIQQLCRSLKYGTRLDIDHNTFYQLAAPPFHDIQAYTLKFQGCGDIHPMKFPKAPKTQILWFENCDKNFSYYWLRPRLWPLVQYIILDTRIVGDTYLWLPHDFPHTVFFLNEAEFRSRHMIPCPRYVCMQDNDWNALQRSSILPSKASAV